MIENFQELEKKHHFYGNITMKNNKIEFINGSFLNTMKKRTTFIVDEMNLSPEML